MDKYEYKLRLEEIKTLNRKGRFQEAAQTADTIDWTKVRNVSTLGIISDVYKINRRFEDAKDILLLADEKSPQNRRIVYALCDLTIKMGQVVEAVEYYKEFVQLAPNDNSKYILLYKIYEAQDISLEERIAVLKEYKKREYNEKWAYELAFLYHRVGLATECVEECDQLILWFGEGKYVTKAMELKKLYVPLSPAQQQAYDRLFGHRQEPKEAPAVKEEEQKQKQPEPSEKQEKQEEELDIQVKPMDMGKYNTINLQAALAESMKEVLEPEDAGTKKEPVFGKPEAAERSAAAAAMQMAPETGMHMVQPENAQEGRMEQNPYGRNDVRSQEEVSEMMRASADWDAQATGQIEAGETEMAASGAGRQQSGQSSFSKTMRKPEEMEHLLAQEYDGQISLALPEDKAVEKQITGQMNIEDVLAEWEQLKKQNEEKRRRETKQWMLQQTGSLFEDFDHLSRDGVLEKLQREESLPVETVQRDRVEDPSALGEVEELEEIEDIEELEIPSYEPKGMPAPAAQPAAMQEQSSGNGRQTSTPDQAFAATQDAPQSRIRQFVPAPQPAAVQEPYAPTPQPAAAQEPYVPVQQPAPAQEPYVPTPQPAAAQEPYAPVQQPAPAQEAYVPTPQPAAAQEPYTPVQQPAPVQEPQPLASQPAPVQETRPQPEQEDSVQEESSRTEKKQPEAAGDTEAFQARISEQQLREHVRSMTKEEKALFAPFVPTKGAMRQLVQALDMLSLSAFTGNMIITGAPGSDMMKLAKNVIREVRASDQNFSGKIAKISGEVLNAKSAEAIIAKIPNGALIIEKAGKLSDEGTENLFKALNQEHTGIIVILLDSKRTMERLLERNTRLASCFTARFDIAALDSGTLVKYGCQYAYNMEYSIDELGRLALHTRIEDLQTSTHAVTIEEVREIVDEAIEHANKKTLGHFMDILVRKRYDEDDMIVLREKDFI